MYICIYVYVYVCIYIYMYIYIYIYIFISTPAVLALPTRRHCWRGKAMHIYIHIYMYVCTYVCIHIHLYRYLSIYRSTSTSRGAPRTIYGVPPTRVFCHSTSTIISVLVLAISCAESFSPARLLL